MIRRGLAGLVVAAGVAWPVSPAATEVACAGEQPHAALVVDTGANVYSFCVELPAPTVSGIDLIELAGQQFDLDYHFGFGGNAVCRLAGVGPSGDDCFEDYPEFWGYWRGDGSGGWVWSGSGAGSTQVGDGDIDGWSWGAGDNGESHPAPPPATFASVCAEQVDDDGPGGGDGGDGGGGGGGDRPGSAPGSSPPGGGDGGGRSRGDGGGSDGGVDPASPDEDAAGGPGSEAEPESPTEKKGKGHARRGGKDRDRPPKRERRTEPALPTPEATDLLGATSVDGVPTSARARPSSFPLGGVVALAGVFAVLVVTLGLKRGPARPRRSR